MVDVDATLIDAASDDKDGAGATFKGGWGFHPILGCLDRGDGTGEALAGVLRSGNRAANRAVDNVEAMDAALAQLPELPDGVELVVRGDTALATHDVISHLVGEHEVGFSVSYEVTDAVRDAILDVDDDAWIPAITQDGRVRNGAHVVELTDVVNLASWPDGTRLIVRREPLHPGAQQTIDDVDGYRFTVMLTSGGSRSRRRRRMSRSRWKPQRADQATSTRSAAP